MKKEISVSWTNTLLDDIAAVVGFTPAVLIAALHGGNSLYVPESASAGHPLVTLLGPATFRRLADEWGGQTIHVPLLNDFERWRNVACAGAWQRQGQPVEVIAARLGMGKRYVVGLLDEAKALRPRLRLRADLAVSQWCRTRLIKVRGDGGSLLERMQAERGQLELFDGRAPGRKRTASTKAGDPGAEAETRVREPAQFG